jgi:SAM-dependent methyltransferase
MKCTLCGLDSLRHYHDAAKPFSLYQCPRCRFVFIPEELYKGVEIDRQYLGDESSTTDYYLASGPYDARNFRDLFQRIAAYQPAPGRLLDVGANVGTCLEAGRTLGWDGTGVEPNQKACTEIARRGIPCHTGFFNPDMIRSRDLKDFDLVTLNDVIEHVFDPLAMIRDAGSVLKTGGLLAVVSPDIDTWFCRKFQIKPLEHLVYFNKPSIRYALEQAGFEVLFCRTTPRWRDVANMSRSTARFSPLERLIIRFATLPGVNAALCAAVRLLVYDEFTAIARKRG